MSLRRTKGIVTDNSSSDPVKEADVIMTAAALGLAGDYIATTRQPLQFDMDPLDAHNPKEPAKSALFNYLRTHGSEPTLGGVLILDAVTLHDPELNRISRTLQ